METPENSIISLKNEIKANAIENVVKLFPTKVIQLSELLDDQRFKFEFDVTDQPNIPVSVITSNAKALMPKPEDIEEKSDDESNEEQIPVNAKAVTVHCNRYLVEMLALVYPRMLEFTEQTLLLSAAISLLMPPIEDGNNFGVEIQQECYETVNACEHEVQLRIHEFHKYFTTRADLVTKAIKHSNCEDYRIAIREKDKLFHRYLVISLTVVRNNYLNLHDLILKNLNKIKKPKSGVTTNFLY